MMNLKDKNMEISSISFPETRRLLLKKIFIPILLFAVLLVLFAGDLRNTFWILILSLLGLIIIAVINYYHMKVFYFAIAREYVIIKRHAVNPHEIVIEFARIEDIVVYRDTLDKMLGLYQIRFKTDLISPKAQKMAYLEGLDEVEANELKVVLDHKLAKIVRKNS